MEFTKSNSKFCKSCHTLKLSAAFNIDRHLEGGLSSKCRECYKPMNKLIWAKRKAKYQELQALANNTNDTPAPDVIITDALAVLALTPSE